MHCFYSKEDMATSIIELNLYLDLLSCSLCTLNAALMRCSALSKAFPLDSNWFLIAIFTREASIPIERT